MNGFTTPEISEVDNTAGDVHDSWCCSCANWGSHKGKQRLGFRAWNYAPADTRNDHSFDWPRQSRRARSQVPRSFMPQEGDSTAQYSLLCLHKLPRNKGTAFALPDNSAVAKAGIWSPFLGPHGQGTQEDKVTITFTNNQCCCWQAHHREKD